MLYRHFIPALAALLASLPGVRAAQGESDPPDPASLPAEAAAEPAPAEPDPCPDGWFCEPGGPESAATPAAKPEEPPPREAPEKAAAPASGPPAASDSRRTGPTPPEAPQRQRYGLVGRLNASLLGGGSSARTPFMTGIGAAFRMRPLSNFALEAALEGFKGRDFVGAARTEVGVSVTTQLFFNPQHRTVAYLPAGLFHSWAHVEPVSQSARDYRYIGAFLGVGVERSFDAHWAAFADIVGFLRGRSDSRAALEPEYVDLDTGRVTNSSGGGLFRIGATYYF